jgi:glycosyl transferase family 7 (putative galactosyltransferase)
MRVSVLVAFRDDSGAHVRQRLWDFVRGRVRSEHPDFEIVEGCDDGLDPFNKCQAINRAASVASGDVFYILDCDTYVVPGQVEEALLGIRCLPGHWWRPWTQKVKLSPEDTEQVLTLGEAWDGTISKEAYRRAENRNGYWSSPPLMLPREMFERVGGMDERFVGWGQEDDGFAHSLRAFYGLAEGVSGQCAHLWHPRIGKSGRDQWPGQAGFQTNVPLALRYKKASRKREDMDALIAERTVMV